MLSERVWSERFDSTIGAGTVLMPFGGKYQLTPTQAMAKQRYPLTRVRQRPALSWAGATTRSCTRKEPLSRRISAAVVESVSKLIAAGAKLRAVLISHSRNILRKHRITPTRWGKPFSALLGAFKAQIEPGNCGAIGGKDSMSRYI